MNLSLIRINTFANYLGTGFLVIISVAIIVLGPKDFPVMLKKAGSWIGTAKRYINNIQNEVSNIDIDMDDNINNEIKEKNKKDE